MLVLFWISYYWSGENCPLHWAPPPHRQGTCCRQQIIDQKGRKYTFCVLAEKGRRLLLQLCFTAVSWMSVQALPGTQVWATPSTLAHPFEPASMASAKSRPFIDRKVNSKVLVHDKWIGTSNGLVLFLCLTPTIQDFQYKPDWTNTNVFCGKKIRSAESIFGMWIHIPSFSQASLSAKVGFRSANSC